jgi:hypothetical protein
MIFISLLCIVLQILLSKPGLKFSRLQVVHSIFGGILLDLALLVWPLLGRDVTGLLSSTWWGLHYIMRRTYSSICTTSAPGGPLLYQGNMR